MRTFKTHRRLYEQNLRNIAIFDDDGFRPDISDINDGDDEGE